MNTRSFHDRRGTSLEGGVVASLMPIFAACIVFAMHPSFAVGLQDHPLGGAIVLALVLLPVLGTAPMMVLGGGGKRNLRDVLKLAIPACLLPLVRAFALLSPILVFSVAAFVVGGWFYWLGRNQCAVAASGFGTPLRPA